jgi:Skp family chaperone for outer membrane proteins
MDGPSQQKKGFVALISLISMAAMGAGIAAAVIATSKTKAASSSSGRIEKSVIELNSKFDRIFDQLKSIQPEINATAKEAEKKPEGAQQRGKPQDVIYVRKSSDFSFYN